MSYNTEQMREYMRKRRKNRREQGLCVQCGKYSGERSYCEVCAAKAAANNRKSHERKRNGKKTISEPLP